MKMKNALSLAVTALAITTATPAYLSATSIEDAYIESYRGRTDIPVPIAVESPRVTTEHVGRTVELEFTVDEKGRPRDIVGEPAKERDLVDSVLDAVEDWRFAPLRDAQGRPRSAKVRLPVIITEPARY